MKTILVDLDGVLNQYNGNYNENLIPPKREGADDFLKKLSEEYHIKLFTTRSRLLCAKWLIENKLEGYIQDITNIKEPAFLHIDDRCIQFNGNYDQTLKQINNFKVWYK